jgi:hypothetical protein
LRFVKSPVAPKMTKRCGTRDGSAMITVPLS